jgi:hypothetical protein
MNSTKQLKTRMTLALLLVTCGIGNALAQTNQTKYGTGALSMDAGDSNSAFGQNALFSNTTGSSNTATGLGALQTSSTGNNNTAAGANALFANTTGSGNTAFGYSALSANTTGNDNSASGVKALYGNTTGIRNTAAGNYALVANTSGFANDAVGFGALWHNTTGSNNTASGYAALYSNTTGSNNVAIGPYAAYYPTTGSGNIHIGNHGTAADNAVIRIGVQGTQKSTAIAGISGVNVTGGATVVVNTLGQLGVRSSSRRYKEDIRSMGNSSERLLKLRPVTFEYKQPDEKGQKPRQYGLIAEEVAQVMPELVVYNQKGQPEAIAYEALAPLLLNELKREHTRSEDRVMGLRKQLAAQAEELALMKSQLAELRRLAVQPAVAHDLDVAGATQVVIH